MLGELGGRQLLQPSADDPGGDHAAMVRGDPAVEHEAARLGILEGLRQHLVQIQDLDPALLHLQQEVVMVLLGLVHPDHVVEQQIVAVAGREALMGKTGPADHHRPQLADLRVNAELSHRAPPAPSVIASAGTSARQRTQTKTGTPARSRRKP